MAREVIVHTQYGNFKVDPTKLAENLKFSKTISSFKNVRPGEPLYLTGTSSDPISHEKFETLKTVLHGAKAK